MEPKECSDARAAEIELCLKGPMPVTDAAKAEMVRRLDAYLRQLLADRLWSRGKIERLRNTAVTLDKYSDDVDAEISDVRDQLAAKDAEIASVIGAELDRRIANAVAAAVEKAREQREKGEE